MTVTVTSQIPDDLAALLTRICETDERSKSYYVRKGLELILQQRQEDIEDYEDAVRALEEHRASGDKTFTLDEVFAKK